MLLETFYKDCIKTLCTGAHKRTQIHCSLWTKFLVNETWYICTKHNEINIFLSWSKTCKLQDME